MAAQSIETDQQAPTLEEELGGETAFGRIDLLQLAFWGCLLVAVAAASVAIAWPGAVGGTGPILLISMAAGGMVFLLWVLKGAGRRLVLFPHKGAAEDTISTLMPRFCWIESLDEAVLIADQGGAPIAANEQYRELTQIALAGQQDSSAPVTVDRLFSASPGLAAPIFRLSKSAKIGEARREVLPAMTIGADSLPVQYEVSVAGLPRDRVIWRLRRINGAEAATGSADMKALYIEDAPLGFFAAKPDGTITYANGWLREMIGLPETAKNIRLDDIMRPEFVKMLGRDKKTGAAGRANIMLRTRDGVEMPVQTVTTWSGRGADAQGRTVVIANGQTQLEGEGRFLAASASRPAKPDSDPMFDDAPFGAVRLEGNSVETAIIMDANRVLMSMSEGKSAPGTAFSDLFLTDDDGDDTLAEKLIDAIDKPMPLKLAGDEPKSVNVFVTLDNMGQPSVAYIIDMTEQKELELRLAQGEKMQAIGQLAGGVAHDFNNVLTGIMLNNDELMMRHPVGDPSYENLKSIHEFAVRAKDLVHMLLAYARQQTFKREVFNVTDWLSELSLLIGQILDERIEFKTVPARNLPYIKADKNQLETAIFNLVTNARDAMLHEGGSGGKLIIKTSRATGADAHKHGFNFVEDGEYLLIEVTDTGHGIPAKIMDKIFQPFFTTKDVGVGTGLGLATVYGIIKQSEGYVCPISHVGQGTTFQIYLPALKADDVQLPEIIGPEEEAVDHRPVDISGRGKILLVEDERGVRDIAVMHLISRGYEVTAAEDGEEALEILEDEAGTFDLIISDVVMPGMDGPALIKAAKEYLGDARVIFISGYAERDLAKKLDDDREISFLPKPFNVKSLAERVKQQLGMKKEREAA